MEANLMDRDDATTSAASLGGDEVLRCEDEPIRIPGSIQRHGFLLLLDRDDAHVVAASQNVEEFLEVPYGLILGTPVGTLFDREILGALRAQPMSGENTGGQTYLGSFPLRGKYYSVVTHRVEGERILEFERIDRLTNPEMANEVFTNFVSQLNNLRTEQSLCEALAEQVRTLTGFNRVLIYRFDEFGHGTVLSESSDGVLPSYLDLRFPESDIPRQARDLYILNTVRTIPDATYVPSPLLAMGQRPIGALDLSMSILRSVSPVHLEYMRNMGTISSMSVSLICEGKLWGLISGHHAEPRLVPYLVRSACDLLSKLVCTQLINFQTSSHLNAMVHFHTVQRGMLTQMAAENNYLSALEERMSELIQITDAAGVALVLDGHATVFGLTPPVKEVKRLAEWMDDQSELDLFHSRRLGADIDWAGEFSEVASGLLVIRTSSVRQSYLMWFRPEVVRTVKWAGEVKTLSGKDQLNPRKSFETWRERVRGQSTAWTEMEIESAMEFRAALTTISLKRAEEAVQLGEARFVQLTHALPNPVWTADDDGELTYVNEKWREQGLADRGRWYEQERLAAEDQQRCAELWKAAVKEQVPFELEVRFRPASDNTERWNLARVVPYLRRDGSLGGWVGTFTDLTSRRQREAALGMTEKLALTGRMTSVIAHEINNPLEAITNLLYLLGDLVKDDESARGYIELAEAELLRISGITKQTLRWSKESVQRAEYGFAGGLFEEALRIFAAQIKNREVVVVLEGGEDVRFYGIIGQVGQVVANLLSNAIQAVAVGGRIWLGARADGETMEIAIRDNGCGMSDETLRNLYRPFYTTKGDLGNGLGLYITHEIVERSGGRLEVKSELGRGTEVRVHLPANGRESIAESA